MSLYYTFNVSKKNVFISKAADLVLKEIANEVKSACLSFMGIYNRVPSSLTERSKVIVI